MRSAPFEAARVHDFLADLTEVDGHPPFSEHKLASLGGDGNRVAAWSDDAGLCLVAVAARHRGDGHWAIEAALAPRRRTANDETLAIQRAVELTPAGEPHSFWAFRPGQADAALRLGYEQVRAVLRMSGPMPTAAEPTVSGISIKPMSGSEVVALLGVNNRAFAHHREQGSMTEDEFRSLMTLAWFDAGGVHVARSGGRIAGFCVTKPERREIGEVYLLAVDPDFAGLGIGRALLHRGLARLAERGAATAQAWVDAANVAAVGLYEAAGLFETFRTAEFVPSTGG